MQGRLSDLTALQVLQIMVGVPGEGWQLHRLCHLLWVVSHMFGEPSHRSVLPCEHGRPMAEAILVSEAVPYCEDNGNVW